MRKNLHDLRLGDKFLDMTPTARSIKENLNYWTPSKLNSFALWKIMLRK